MALFVFSNNTLFWGLVGIIIRNQTFLHGVANANEYESSKYCGKEDKVQH